MSPTAKINLESIAQTALFQKVSDICNAVNAVISPKELLENSLKLTLELFGARRGSIFILNDGKRELVLKTSIGMKSSEQKNLVKRLGEGIVGKVAQLKKPIFVADISDDTLFRNYKARTSYDTPSFICAPLLIKDSLIGVINIADKDSGTVFTHQELQLLDFLSTQIALNFRRIQLYQKFKKLIKESKSLKNELGKSSKEAIHLKKQIIVQEKFASIGKLAGGIAHEFNNPLDGVMRYTNLSLEHVKDDEVVRGYLLEVKQGLNRMANIVRSLLACSRNVPPNLQKIDIKQAIDQVTSGLKAPILQKSIVLEKTFDPEVQPVMDLGVELIISNLLRNAIDAVGEKGEISISTKLSGKYIVVSVSDSGCGFSPELAEKIFEPFFTTKDIDKGCGLGLTIVNEIVKSYNGKITVESMPDRGATFTVFIPKSENDQGT